MNLDFSNFSVLVIGDLMLDRYWHGTSNRLSPEAPVPIVKIEREDDRLGGAGNVALNLSKLKVNTSIIAIAGKDDNKVILKDLLINNNINSELIELDNFRTITKLRILSSNQQCVRVDFEDIIENNSIEYLKDVFTEFIQKVDLVVLSDYAKGTLFHAGEFIKIANQFSKPVIADPKGNSFLKYSGSTLITPNYAEFVAIVGPCSNELEIEEKAQRLILDLNLKALLLTRSEKGMTLFQKFKKPFHLNAIKKNVFDVTGAGDTVIATLAACMASGMVIEDAVKYSNIAAGFVVSMLGTTAITLDELKNEIYFQST